MHGEDLLQPVATRCTPFSREFCGFVGRLTHFFCGCPILMPRSYNAAANRARNFSCKSLENSSGGTRTRTGDTMIFRHVPLFTVERRWLPLGPPKLKSG